MDAVELQKIIAFGGFADEQAVGEQELNWPALAPDAVTTLEPTVKAAVVAVFHEEGLLLNPSLFEQVPYCDAIP